MRPGERARVHVVSPFADGDAWVTVEREGVLEQRRVRVGRGDNVITVPIAERYAPNVHVFVAVVPHSDAATRPDSTTERFRAGYVGLSTPARESSTSSLPRIAGRISRATRRRSASRCATTKAGACEARWRCGRSTRVCWRSRAITFPTFLAASIEPRGRGGPLELIANGAHDGPDADCRVLAIGVLRAFAMNSVCVDDGARPCDRANQLPYDRVLPRRR